jgi:hypothetical protein
MSGSGKIKLVFGKFNDAAISMSGSGSVELKGNISNNLSVHQAVTDAWIAKMHPVQM